MIFRRPLALFVMRHDAGLGLLDDDLFLYDDDLALLAGGIVIGSAGRGCALRLFRPRRRRGLRRRLRLRLGLFYEIRLLLRILGIVRHTLPLRLVVLVLET
jgi:hypothetical protein